MLNPKKKKVAKRQVDGEVTQDNTEVPTEDAPTAAETTPARDFTAERDTEVLPAARELLARLAVRQDLKMGAEQKDFDAAAKYYQLLYQEELIPLVLKYNLKLKDIGYMFSVMLQPIQLLMDVTTESFRMNEDIANSKKWGVATMRDLRVTDLNDVLLEKEVKPEVASVDNTPPDPA